ncbi:MAG: fused MFS/spermidine synthase [Betaproteobacteria bacterium]|nr:fused MFS/spermidine synthase [Betaproteobacteria bacterium]
MRAGIVVSEEAGVRYLHFGSRWIQGAMRLQRPWALELEYTRQMMAPLAMRPAGAWPRDVLIVGLGAASQLRFLWRHRPAARFTVVEIDEQVVSVARQSFKLPDDERIRLVVGDAVDEVPSLAGSFDLVLIDGFDARGSAGRLDSVPFYAACRERLAPGGFLSVNLLSRTRGVKPSLARLAEVFGERVLALPRCVSGNTVAFAWREGGPRVDPADWPASALALKRETGLDLRAPLAGIDREQVSRVVA